MVKKMIKYTNEINAKIRDELASVGIKNFQNDKDGSICYDVIDTPSNTNWRVCIMRDIKDDLDFLLILKEHFTWTEKHIIDYADNNTIIVLKEENKNATIEEAIEITKDFLNKKLKTIDRLINEYK